jgi:protease IV
MSEFETASPAGERPGDRAGGIPPVPLPPPRRAHPIFWLAIGVAVVLFVAMTILTTFLAAMSNDRQVAAGPFWKSKVGIVPVEGEIFEATEVVETLRAYADQRQVKAIVVRINSPGGAIVPSQEIFSEIRRIRQESGKPVVASLDSVAASGGYYVAVACDRIVANPGTLTGSIGVILQWLNLEELVKWARLKPETLTSGPLKDTGTPFREMTDSERAYLQNLVGQMHGQFVRAVADGRKGKLSEADVVRLADGRVFTGEEARNLRLVDDLGNLHDAVMLAGRLAGIRGEPETVTPRRRQRGLLDLLVGSARADQVMNQLLNRKPQILYRW